ncbi:MAG: DUF1576 domain-containing protein [Candidatus Phytoplasma sp.]|nr:DUF1576 domain-containing protein [Phytoplasma sp.]
MGKKRLNYLLFLAFFISLLLLLFIGDPVVLFQNYFLILKNPGILLTDFLAIAGLRATLLNVFITLLLNVLLLKFYKQELTGGVIACLFTIAGFSFFGKSSINFIPLYLGVILYTKIHKFSMKDHINVLLLSSGLSPIVSYLVFGSVLNPWVGLLVGVSLGVLIGYLLPIFNAHALKFHQGYNLYATGFSMGILSMVVTGVLNSLHISVQTVYIVSKNYHWFLLYATIFITVSLILAAFILKPNLWSDYKKIITSTGRLSTDFTKVGSLPATLLNMGFMGIISIVLTLALHFLSPNGFTFLLSGPSFGAILTVIGFGAFGKHPSNTIPVILGALVSMYLTPISVTTGTIIAIYFVTGLAPITGRFGILAGFLAGFIHLMITPLALSFQGGFDLYNNGFAAGFVAAIIASIFVALRKDIDSSDLHY